MGGSGPLLKTIKIYQKPVVSQFEILAQPYKERARAMRPPPTPLTPTGTILVTLLCIGLAIFFWSFWGPIAWRAVRTGRLLGRGAVYDRQSTPKMYWFGFFGMLSVALMFTGLAVWAMSYALAVLGVTNSN